MLKLKNIYKIYETGDLKQTALNGVSLNFRKNEFVAILGHSGSGKTTMLNIIGGLDRYDKGDLIINGKSTKKYKDRNWDAYRNHSIGFVFQSYNLIPHQTILSNVELALTLAGVSKAERRKRAEEVLDKVGLKDHIHKRPNQLSGGQMQRVAIARALINDPEILLADEPTGALDSDTSVQIMELLKEIAKDRLIIMVTHNPDLANTYANRIIKLRDGNIVDDSNPLTDEEELDEIVEKDDQVKKPSMSFGTALSLSLNNLRTKKGRTFMTAFAGSIGIIGIALILSLSAGIKGYINKVQEDTLSSYPITIESVSMDYSGFISAITGENKEEHDKDKIYSNNTMASTIKALSSQISNNDLKTFKKYVDSHKDELDKYVNDIQYTYNFDLQIYSKDTSKGIYRVNPSTLFDGLGMGENSHFMTASIFKEMIDSPELLESQYDIVAGKWPTEYNEIVLVADANNEVNDMALYTLGLLDPSELTEMFKKIASGEKIEENKKATSYTYDEILNLEYKLLLNTDYYVKEGNVWKDMSKDMEYMKKKIDNADIIKIAGIIRPKDEVVATSITGSIAYTSKLTEHIINEINKTEIAKEQRANEKINVFTGEEFVSENNPSFSQLSSANQATYDKNLQLLGIADVENPYAINIYCKDFDSKDDVEKFIKDYNKKNTDEGNDQYVVKYTDYVGLMMSSVTTIVDIISYVLIAFVGISLVVSSIMIGIITYVSVLERTKEIGILRSIGASKRDISRVFNAETTIIGFVAGAFGIIVTIVLNIPISAIIKHLADISNVAKLPPLGGVILVVISMSLTVIAGLLPAKMASKKDPVIALRSE